MDIPSIRLHPYMYDCLYPERNEFNELILVEEYKDAMNKLTPYERVVINNIKCKIKYDDMSYLIKLRDEEEEKEKQKRQEKLKIIIEQEEQRIMEQNNRNDTIKIICGCFGLLAIGLIVR
jgi:hypothetical protein